MSIIGPRASEWDAVNTFLTIAETLTDGASIAGLGGEVIPVISTFMRGMIC